MTKDYEEFLEREKRRLNRHVREERRRRLVSGQQNDVWGLVFPVLIIGIIICTIAIVFSEWHTLTGNERPTRAPSQERNR